MRNPIATWAGVGALVLVMSAGSLWAQDAEHAKLSSQELAFLRQRAQDDVFMWRLGEYAAKHGGSDRVRKLGDDIVKERRTDLRDIQELASKHGADIKQPENLSPQQRAVYDQLASQNTKLFDRGFTKTALQAYTNEIGQMERERDHATNVDVREYASKNLQMMKDHQKEARDAEKEVWGS
jgi:putative membrane protein